MMAGGQAATLPAPAVGETGAVSAVPRELKALTSVRFFAAMWVAIFHLRPELEKLVPAARSFLALFEHGHFAVPFFFILSGFILSHSYFPRYRPQDHGHFIMLRFARLWPVHGLTLAALMLYSALLSMGSKGGGPGSAYPWPALPAEFSMVRSWFEKDLVWNYPAWSIQSEWFAYIFLFPVAFVSFRRITNSAMLAVIVVVLLACHRFTPTETLPGKCSDILFLFMAGSALYRLRTQLVAFKGNYAAGLGFGLFVVAAFVGGEGLLLYASFALMVLGLSYDGALTRALSGRLLIYGGTISYSLYMTHALVQKFGMEAIKRFPVDSAPVRAALAMTLVGGLIAAASAAYHLVEAPGNKFIRRWARVWFPNSRCTG